MKAKTQQVPFREIAARILEINDQIKDKGGKGLMVVRPPKSIHASVNCNLVLWAGLAAEVRISTFSSLDQIQM